VIKVGDKVFHLGLDLVGTVVEVDPKKRSSAVDVRFPGGRRGTYSTCGRVWMDDLNCTIVTLTKLRKLLYGIEHV
jgi:hypothetical protein